MTFSIKNIRKNVSLKEFVTFKLGGPAELFYVAETEKNLAHAVNYARRNGLSCFLLGGGSNLVVSDTGVEGLVVRNKTQNTEIVDMRSNAITMSSGFKLKDLVNVAYKNGLTGLEFLTGIPGTIGGAVFGNAGAYGKSIANVLTESEVIFSDGSIQKVENSFFNFSYRNSRLKSENFPVLRITVQLSKGNSTEIKAKMDEIIEQRESKHPSQDIGCAGSFFQNLPPLPGMDRRRAAGAVLEQAGAKQMTFGGASVFEKHANFIINTGSATANDVKELAKLLKAKVLTDFGISLSEEVRYIGK